MPLLTLATDLVAGILRNRGSQADADLAPTVVHAVLVALREPNEAMLGACDNIGLEEVAHDPRRARLYWQAMIDAALEELS